jgi:hypothetical protein
MSKRATTTGYIVAWVVAAVTLAVLLRTGHLTTTPTLIAWLVFAIASVAMLVLWIGALAALGQQRAWGWFAAVLVLEITGLGIIGMVAYAIGGPPGRPAPSFIRPSIT